MAETKRGSKIAALTSGNVWKTLIVYLLPLFGSAFIQQVYSMVDLLIVGNFAANGEQALYAVGQATVIVNILLAFSLGSNGGCSVVVSKHFGENDNKKVWETVFTAVFTFAAMCAAVMIVGFTCGNTFFKLMQVDSGSMSDSLTYLYIYTGSLPFVFLYNIGNGICSALGDSKSPFIFLVFSSVLNIVLDLVFVCVLHWDVAGAAWATFISQALASMLTLTVVIRKMRALNVDGTHGKPQKFSPRLCKDLLMTSIPVILQNSFVSVGNFFVQGRINTIVVDGNTTAAAVGFTAAFKLICMVNTSIGTMLNGFAMYCSQNLAAGKKERVKQGYIAVMTYCLIISCAFALILILARVPLSNWFVDDPSPAAMQCSEQYLLIVSCFLPVVCVKIVSDAAVRGCGGNLGFTISTFTDLILRIVFVYLFTDMGWGFAGVCWAWAIGWSVSMVLAVLFWVFVKPLRGVKYFAKPGSNVKNAA